MSFQTWLAGVRSDVFQAVLPPAGAALTAIAADPSLENAVLQWGKLQVEILAVGPALLKEELQGLAAAVNAEILTVIAHAKTAAPPPAAIPRAEPGPAPVGEALPRGYR